jgi:hypothetical protein
MDGAGWAQNIRSRSRRLAVQVPNAREANDSLVVDLADAFQDSVRRGRDLLVPLQRKIVVARDDQVHVRVRVVRRPAVALLALVVVASVEGAGCGAGG